MPVSVGRTFFNGLLARPTVPSVFSMDDTLTSGVPPAADNCISVFMTRLYDCSKNSTGAWTAFERPVQAVGGRDSVHHVHRVDRRHSIKVHIVHTGFSGDFLPSPRETHKGAYSVQKGPN